MRKIRKSKYMCYGLIGCLLISLITVGFSTWVISIDESEQLFKTNINIELIDNTTVIAQVSSSTKSITLDNTNVDGDGIISSDESNANTDIDLSIHMIVAEEQIKNLENITFSLDAINDTSPKKDLNKATISSNDVFDRSETTDATYLNLNFTSSYDNLKDLEFGNYSIEGFKQTTINIENLKVEYGSFFNNLAPEKFYQTKLNELKNTYLTDRTDDNLNKYLSAIKQAKDELDAMRGALNTKTLNINVSINSSQNSQDLQGF